MNRHGEKALASIASTTAQNQRCFYRLTTSTVRFIGGLIELWSRPPSPKCPKLFVAAVYMGILMSTTSSTILAQTSLWRWMVPPGVKFVGGSSYDLGTENNRYAGLHRWDEQHVLVYALGSAKSLLTRESHGDEPGYLLHVYILDVQTSKVVKSVELPTENVFCELQVVSGGVVVRSGHSLAFYSKEFQKIGQTIAIPVERPPTRWGVEGSFEDWLRLFVNIDGTKFVVACDGGKTGKYYLFDGNNFSVLGRMTIQELITAETFDDSTILFRSNNDTRSILAAKFGQDELQKSSVIYTAKQGACATAAYIDSDRILNTCSDVSIVTLDGHEKVIQALPEQEVSAGRGVLSRDRANAILPRKIKKGGSAFFDRASHTVDFVIDVFDLVHPALLLRIPIVPIPKEIFDYTFINQRTLVVMNDDVVSAYTYN